MEPSAFRRDPWLRSSAYHLVTWSFTAFMLELRLDAEGGVDAANAIAGVVLLLGLGLLSSFTNERRLGKMVGAAGAPVWPAAGRMWMLLFAGLLAASVVLAFGSLGTLLFPLWAVAVGGGFLAWGRHADFAWYAGLGLALIAAGLVDVALGVVAGPVGPFRIFVLGLALPAFALMTNRRFLWFRDEG